jgi:hypothetical protein
MKDFFEKTRVQGRRQTLAGDALLGRMPLEETHGQAPHQRQVLGTMTLADPAGIFCKRDVHVPVQRVLDAPMPTVFD